MKTAPSTYILHDARDGDVLTVAQTLQEASREASDSLWGCYIEAWWGDGQHARAPREAYMRPEPPTRDEALDFIRHRAAKIAEAKNPAIYRAMGCMRCNCDDTEEKQVEEYIASAPWVPRELVDEEWWKTPVLPSAR